MTQKLFTDKPALASHDLAEQAWQSWFDYGSLKRVEDWRWTPLHTLYGIERRIEAADYQVSVPEGVDESSEQGACAVWLKTADAPFAALNLAVLDDTLRITIPDDFNSDEPIAINIDQHRRTMQFSRVHIECGKSAKAALWLDAGVSKAGAQCPIIHLEVAEHAECDAVLWFNGAQDSAQIGHILVHQQAGATVRVNGIVHSGALARLDVSASLHGDEGHFAFGGVQCLKENEIGDYHIHVSHLAENCTSKQVVRGALDDESFGIFDGMIYVAHGAQKTDAEQDSRYILQSRSAKSHSVPRLEIYADDVQCAHGSTVGFLDPEALFYLQSRGIDKETAKKILILSFLHEAVVVEHEGISEALHKAISDLWLGEAAAEEISGEIDHA
ncbi:Fe-S cluster assembly protein SufD [Cardiobacteriaceae bacterium TAE3-ERU3]|nr:Fe-S cluster assembly protein SufD [Cardiobacteriaceae bacterium TAE3-ERU3]